MDFLSSSTLEKYETNLPFVFFITSALTIVTIGSRRSMRKSITNSDEQEIIDFAASSQFPLLAGRVLFLMYILLKFIPSSIFITIISYYLSFGGIVAVNYAIRPMLKPSFFLGLFSIVIGVLYLYTKHWMLANIVAAAFGIVAIENLRLSSYSAAAMLMIGLFLYDIFFVFGTDVMVTVATSIDGPIKLLFPRHLLTGAEGMSLLGLGDIVVPGFYIAFMCSFSYQSSPSKNGFYFYTSLISYFISLVQTIAFMIYYKHAQPALLYIVPWLLITTVAAAAWRGELGALMIESDDEDEEEGGGEGGSGGKKKIKINTGEEDKSKLMRKNKGKLEGEESEEDAWKSVVVFVADFFGFKTSEKKKKELEIESEKRKKE